VIEDNSLDRKIHELVGRFVRDMRDLGVEKREITRLLADFRES